MPGLAPEPANSRASSTVSVTSSGNGQLSPAASNRRIVDRTVDAAAPTRRAISRVGIPADFNLITSRTWRIANLSVGILVHLHKAERRDRIGARRGPRHPGRHHPGMVGEIISECRAGSNRNGGRDHSGMVGDIERNQQTPADLEEPAPITQSASGNSIEENIAVMTNLATGHEAKARRLDSILNEWPRLSPEQQNRRLILALAERLK